MLPVYEQMIENDDPRSVFGINHHIGGKNENCEQEVYRMDYQGNFDIKKADRTLLRDIRDVVIDTSLPCRERMSSYIDQIGNPYCYMDDGIVVALGYADTQVSLQERLRSYVSSLG